MFQLPSQALKVHYTKFSGQFPLARNLLTSGFLSTTPARLGFPGGTSDKESACQRRRRKRRGLNSWVGKIPWRRTWRPTPVSWPGESPWAGYVHGVGKSRTRLKRLGRHTPTRFTLCGCTTVCGLLAHHLLLKRHCQALTQAVGGLATSLPIIHYGLSKLPSVWNHVAKQPARPPR